MITTLKSVLLLLFCSRASILALKQEGDSCTVRFGTQEGFGGVFHYFESQSTGGKCSDDKGLFCYTELDDGKIGKDFPGTCQPVGCFKPLDDTNGRVTICHRTCSETNPWVRVTIDASAWTAHSCGHTTETCNGANLTYWGTHDRDYILKEHGSRTTVANRLGNDATAISDYWKAWEPACPSVRNGECCEFDGTYGYTCCGRAVGGDPMPVITISSSTTLSPISSPTPLAPISSPTPPAPVSSPTAAPIPAPVSSPTAAPIPAPVSSPTDAPVFGPTTQAAPVSSPTDAPVFGPTTQVAPVSSPTDTPVSDPTPAPVLSAVGPTVSPGDSSNCFNRRLQNNALEERWAIDVPSFRYQKSLSFHLEFPISSYISSENMVSYTLMESTCTNSYMGSGLVHTQGLRLPIDGGQRVGLAVWIDPQEISRDTEIYSEGIIDNQMKANVDFCIRFSLYTPPTTSGGAVEVNFMEVIVRFDADLTDGFSIGTLTATPYDRCEQEANDAFEVEGYFCNEGTEATPIEPAVPTLNQGEIVKVCVRPVQDALDQGVRMRALKEFTWILEDGAVQQPAIVDYALADNMLTVMYCTEGYAICHFESILFAAFFASPRAVVGGTGIADLQFGGEASDVSISPKFRRQLRNEGRQLQSDQPTGGGSAEFSLELNLQQASPRSYSGAARTTLRVSTLLLVGSTLLAMVSSSTV